MGHRMKPYPLSRDQQGSLGRLKAILELQDRAVRAKQLLLELTCPAAELLEDENFVTLLRAEKLDLVPECLLKRVESLRRHREE